MSNVLRSNKGQSLALFVIFIPLIIMIATYVIDVGMAKYNENKLNEINKTVIRYGLKNIDNNPVEKMKELAIENDKDIKDIDISITDDKRIKVIIKKETKGTFGSMVGKAIYKEKSSYVGYVDNDKYIIEKER